MENIYKIKPCPKCQQGWLEIGKDTITNRLVFTCSECSTEYLTIEDMLGNQNGSIIIIKIINESYGLQTPQSFFFTQRVSFVFLFSLKHNPLNGKLTPFGGFLYKFN